MKAGTASSTWRWSPRTCWRSTRCRNRLVSAVKRIQAGGQRRLGLAPDVPARAGVLLAAPVAFLLAVLALLGLPSVTATQSPDSLDLLPGTPPLVDPLDVYGAARPGPLSPAASGFPERVY